MVAECRRPIRGVVKDIVPVTIDIGAHEQETQGQERPHTDVVDRKDVSSWSRGRIRCVLWGFSVTGDGDGRSPPSFARPN